MSAGKRSCYVAVPTLSAVCYLLHMYLQSSVLCYRPLEQIGFVLLTKPTARSW